MIFETPTIVQFMIPGLVKEYKRNRPIKTSFSKSVKSPDFGHILFTIDRGFKPKKCGKGYEL